MIKTRKEKMLEARIARLEKRLNKNEARDNTFHGITLDRIVGAMLTWIPEEDHDYAYNMVMHDRESFEDVRLEVCDTEGMDLELLQDLPEYEEDEDAVYEEFSEFIDRNNSKLTRILRREMATLADYWQDLDRASMEDDDYDESMKRARRSTQIEARLHASHRGCRR